MPALLFLFDKAIYGQPGWTMGSIDGQYLYIDTGEIIHTKNRKINGHLTGANRKYTHSHFSLQIDLKNEIVAKFGDQFVVGGITQ